MVSAAPRLHRKYAGNGGLSACLWRGVSAAAACTGVADAHVVSKRGGFKMHVGAIEARTAVHDQGPGYLSASEHNDGVPVHLRRHPHWYAHRAIPALHAQEHRGPGGALRCMREPVTVKRRTPRV